jgi:hypothetical protein
MLLGDRMTVALAKQRVREEFQRLNALSPETAVPLDQINTDIISAIRWNQFKDHGMIGVTLTGLYYLDLDMLDRSIPTRTKQEMRFIIISAIGLIAVFLFTFIPAQINPFSSPYWIFPLVGLVGLVILTLIAYIPSEAK